MTLVEKVNQLLSDDEFIDQFEQDKRTIIKMYYEEFLKSEVAKDIISSEKRINLFVDLLMQELLEHMRNVGYEEFTQEVNYYILDDLVKAGFDSRFNEDIINQLLSMGINPGNTPLGKQQMLYRHLSRIDELKEFIKRKYRDRNPYLKLAGLGSHSTILQYDRLIDAGYPPIYEPVLFKISDDYSNEVRLSLLLQGKTHGYISVVNDIGNGILELPKIANKSFDCYLRHGSHMVDCNGFSATDNVLAVARSVFKGLVVLRSNNIFHRDLWLGNIVSEMLPPHLITSIIDLGIATDIPNSEPKDNRKYGGANDIISLGQFIYKLYTGKNLFNTSITESTWAVADQVKVYREECYQTPELLAKRLEQVEERINGKTNQGLKEIILTCLQATESDPANSSFAHPNTYDKLKELFDKYTNKRMISITDIAEGWNL